MRATTKRSAAFVAAVATAMLAGAASSRDLAAEPSLDEIRNITAKYRDVKVALADGYITDPSNHCETAVGMGRPEALGAMGVHYFRPDLLGIKGPPNPRVDGDGTHTDFRRPSILIYEPQADGSLQLVAVENLVFVKAWKAAGHDAPPSFRGRRWDHMVDDPATAVDEAHMFEPHYDQHVWVHRENPNGVLEPYNPNVSCRHGANKHHAAHDQHNPGGGHSAHGAPRVGASGK